MNNSVDAPNVNELAYARGLGYGYGPYTGHGTFSSPSSNAVRINRNAEITKSESDCNRHLFGQAFRSIQNSFEDSTRAGQFNEICSRLSAVDQRNTDGQFRAELRGADQATSLRMEAKLDKIEDCCCEQKVAMCQMENRLTAEIKAVESRGIERDLNRAERQLESRNIIDTITARCGCCPTPI